MEASSGFGPRINNTICTLAQKMVCDVIYVLAHFNSCAGIQSEFSKQPVLLTSVLVREWQIVLSFPVLACLTW